MTPELLAAYLEVVKNVAAPIWEAALRQQYVMAGQYIVIAIVLGVIGGLLLRQSPITKKQNEQNYESDHHAWIVLAGLGTLFSIAAIGFLLSAFSHIVNPTWYAIGDILYAVGR